MSEHAPRTARFLTDYRLHYQNDRFPLLSFMYAVLAGGEQAIYCDYNPEFCSEYLLKPFGGSYEHCPPHVQRFLDRLGRLEARSQGMTIVAEAEPSDWEVFLDCLKVEINQNDSPDPAW